MASGWGGISQIIEDERKRKEEREAAAAAAAAAVNNPPPRPGIMQTIANWQGQGQQQGPAAPQPTAPQPGIMQTIANWQRPNWTEPEPQQQGPQPQQPQPGIMQTISNWQGQGQQQQSQSTQLARPTMRPQQGPAAPQPTGPQQGISQTIANWQNQQEPQANQWGAEQQPSWDDSQGWGNDDDDDEDRPNPIRPMSGNAAAPWMPGATSQYSSSANQSSGSFGGNPEPSLSGNFWEEPQRQDVFNNAPEPIQNQFGPALQQGWDATTGWYTDRPEYMQAQERTKDRRGYEPTSVLEAAAQGFGIGGGFGNILGGVTGGLVGAGIGAANRTDWGREAIIRSQDALDRVFEVPGMIAVNTDIPGVDASLSQILTSVGLGIGNAITHKDASLANIGLWYDIYARAARGEYDASKATANFIEQVGAGNPSALLALRNKTSGSSSMMETYNAVMNREADAARLEQEAVAIQQSNPTLAGQKFAQAQELRAMSNADAVDSNMNPLAEFFYGMVFDPTNVVGPLMGILGLTTEGRVAGRANRAMTLTKEQAIGNANDGRIFGEGLMQTYLQDIEAGKKQYTKWLQEQTAAGTSPMLAPFQVAGKKAIDYTKLFRRTAESRAALDTEILWQGIGSIASGIVTKEDMKLVLDALVTAPDQLVKGLKLGQEALSRLAQSDGTVKWGTGVLHKDFTSRLPILQMAKENIVNLASLKGAGNFNPVEFLAELNGAIVDGAMRLNGGKQPKVLPFGATDVRVRRIGPNDAIVDYLDAQGKVLQRSTEMALSEANRRVENIKAALKPGGMGALDWVMVLPNVQRAIMSDWWLGLRPANWVGNALGATVSLFANDAYTLMRNTDIQDYMGGKFGGGTANRRLYDAVSGNENLTRGIANETGSGAIDKTASALAKLFGKKDGKNPVSDFMQGVYNIPFGDTEIKLPNGLSIPFGEGAFFNRATYYPFMRSFNAAIKDSIGMELLPRLQQIEGMTPELSKTLTQWVQTISEAGGKGDVLPALRKLVGAPVIKMNLKELGLLPEVLSPQAHKAIEWLMHDAAPHQADQVMKEISRVLVGERNPAASLSNISPQQIGLTDWVTVDTAQEAATLADDLIREAQRAGMDVAIATKDAQATAQRFVQGQEQAMNRVIQDLTGASNDPSTWGVAIDFWAQVDKAKKQVRFTVDEAGREARNLNTKEAWQQKWNLTKQSYEDLAKNIERIGEESRTTLQGVLGGAAYESADPWYFIDNYVHFDEGEFRTTRQIKLGRAAEGISKEWQQVIDANRAYFDNAMYGAMGAFQRYPSVDNFQLIRETHAKAQIMGAQVRSTLDDLLKSGVSGDAYAAARNRMWDTYFDAGVTYSEYIANTIVYNGLVEQAGANVKWLENGTEYTLLRPSEIEGKWIAIDPKGKEQEFSAADSASEVSPFTVPQETLGEWQRIFGNGKEDLIEQATDEVLAEIAASAPEVLDAINRTLSQIPAIIVERLTPPQVITKLQEAFKLPKAEAQGLSRVLDARAKTYADMTGQPPGSWFTDNIVDVMGDLDNADLAVTARISRFPGEPGLVEVFKALTDPANGLDASRRFDTAVHEMAHLFHDDMIRIAEWNPTVAQALGKARSWAKVSGSTTDTRFTGWTKVESENFADGFVTYLREKNSPVPALTALYEQFRTWMDNVVGSLTGRDPYFTRNTLTPEIRQIYDDILGGTELGGYNAPYEVMGANGPGRNPFRDRPNRPSGTPPYVNESTPVLPENGNLAPSVQPGATHDLDFGGAFAGAADAIKQNQRKAFVESMAETGNLPRAEIESKSLLWQVHERLLASGVPKGEASVDAAMGIVQSAGNQASNAQGAMDAWFAGRRGSAVPTAEELANPNFGASATPEQLDEINRILPPEPTTWTEPDAPQHAPGFNGDIRREPTPPAQPWREPLLAPETEGYGRQGVRREPTGEPIAPAGDMPVGTRKEQLKATRDAASAAYVKAPSANDLRRLASEQGIPTATESGRPVEWQIRGSLDKRAGINKPLGKMSPAERLAAEEALTKRAAEQGTPKSYKPEDAPDVPRQSYALGDAPDAPRKSYKMPATTNMFAETNEDLPLMSGMAQRSTDAGTFKPAIDGGQERMFDTRPTMGDGEPTYAPNERPRDPLAAAQYLEKEDRIVYKSDNPNRPLVDHERFHQAYRNSKVEINAEIRQVLEADKQQASALLSGLLTTDSSLGRWTQDVHSRLKKAFDVDPESVVEKINMEYLRGYLAMEPMGIEDVRLADDLVDDVAQYSTLRLVDAIGRDITGRKNVLNPEWMEESIAYRISGSPEFAASVLGDPPPTASRPPASAIVEPEVAPIPKPTETASQLAAQTKKQLVAKYGDSLRATGVTEGKLTRMSKQELTTRIEGLGDNPSTSYSPNSETAVYTVGDAAQQDIQSLRETRKMMAQEWDANVTSAWDIGSLDTYAMKYGKGGQVNMSMDKGELKVFEDMYGTTVASKEINDIFDVESYLQQYMDLNKEIKKLEGVVKDSKTFAKMSTEEIVKTVRPELEAAGYTDGEITELAKSRRGLLDTVEAVRELDTGDINMKTYEMTMPSAAHLLGVESDDFLRPGNFRDWMNRSRKTGRDTAPQMGEIAADKIRNIDELERTLRKNMRAILEGKPNELNNYQKMAAIDAVADWLPQFDTALTKAQRVGNDMANWMMLNYQDRRNMDTVMSILTPYHYFWSRMPSRVLMGALQKPSLVNLYYETQRAVALENEKSDRPDRLDGQIPIPGTNATINVMRLFEYAIPFSGYVSPNPFIQEDPTDNEAEKWAKTVSKWTPGLFKTWEILLDAADGNLDKDYSNVLNQMMPIPGVGIPISTAQQWMTGKMPPQHEGLGKFGFGPDEADPYRATRAAEWIAQEEGIDKEMLGYANQVIMNQNNGDPEGTNIPEQYLAEAQALAERAVIRAAEDRALARGSSYLSTMAVNPYPGAEMEIREGSEQFWASGYNPETNLYGSKGLQQDILEANPTIERSWVNSGESGANPGISAQIGAIYDEQNVLYDEVAAAEAAAIAGVDVSNMTVAEMNAVKQAASAGLWQQIEANKKKIDGLETKKLPKEGESTSNPTGGMSPAEIEQERLNDIFDAAGNFPGYPGKEPPAGLSKEEIAAWYDKRSEWYAAKDQSVIDRLTAPNMGQTFMPTIPGTYVNAGRKTYTVEEANKLWKDHQNRYKTEKEINRLGAIGAERELRESFNANYDEFYSLDSKDHDARLAYMQSNPGFAEYEAQRQYEKYGKVPYWAQQMGLEGKGEAGAGDGKKLGPIGNRLKGIADGKNAGGTGTLVDDGNGGYVYNPDFQDERDQFFGMAGEKDWDGQIEFLKNNPEYAAYELAYNRDRKGEDPWWYDQVFGEGGGGDGKKLGPTGRKLKGIAGGGTSGGGSSEAQWGDEWDAYRSFGEKDWDGKRQYMLDNPEFSDYYVKKYGKDAAWWLKGSYSKGGGSGNGSYSKGSRYQKGSNYSKGSDSTYNAEFDDEMDYFHGELGDSRNFDAQKQFLIDNPEFAEYELARYRRKNKKDPWWFADVFGGDDPRQMGAIGRAYGATYASSGGSGGGYRSYSGGGGSYGGGGGGGGGGGYGSRPFPPQSIPTQRMNSSLWDSQLAPYPWKPESDSTPDWLNAGRELAPDPIRRWQRPRF